MIVLGCVLILLGIIFSVMPGKLLWFGNIFGDLTYESKNFKVFSPLGSMLIISIVLTLILNYIIK